MTLNITIPVPPLMTAMRKLTFQHRKKMKLTPQPISKMIRKRKLVKATGQRCSPSKVLKSKFYDPEG